MSKENLKSYIEGEVARFFGPDNAEGEMDVRNPDHVLSFYARALPDMDMPFSVSWLGDIDEHWQGGGIVMAWARDVMLMVHIGEPRYDFAGQADLVHSLMLHAAEAERIQGLKF